MHIVSLDLPAAHSYRTIWPDFVRRGRARLSHVQRSLARRGAFSRVVYPSSLSERCIMTQSAQSGEWLSERWVYAAIYGLSRGVIWCYWNFQFAGAFQHAPPVLKAALIYLS